MYLPINDERKWTIIRMLHTAPELSAAAVALGTPKTCFKTTQQLLNALCDTFCVEWRMQGDVQLFSLSTALFAHMEKIKASQPPVSNIICSVAAPRVTKTFEPLRPSLIPSADGIRAGSNEYKTLKSLVR
jgi:hypothetical protein